MGLFKDNGYYSLQNIKMLVIDDDESLSKSIKFFFEDLNCIVTTAKNGEEGIEIFKTEKPDIVLVDLNMPGIGGHGVISHISRNSQDVPIVVVSGTGVIKEAIRSMNLGAWEYVSKPILHFEELEMSVLRALEKAFLIKENRVYKQDLEKLVKKRTKQLYETIAELEVAKKDLEKADTLKNEFLGQMSHEIRTPLNAILSYLELISLEIDVESNEIFKTGLDAINKGSKRLIRTIELIIRMAELISHNYRLINSEVNLCETIQEVMFQLKNVHPRRNVQIICDESIIVKVDEVSITQILLNIIDNALKFSNDTPVKITLNRNIQGLVMIEIQDYGIGMSEGFMKTKLFSPFCQEHTGYTRDFEGNGLGLALTKGYCDLNNILIFIKSDKGKGTVVQLIFNETIDPISKIGKDKIEKIIKAQESVLDKRD